MITLPLLAADHRVRHAFFTRRGGVSGGIFRSLNCGFGSGDDDGNVARNRAIAIDRLGLAAESLATCRQVHGVAVVAVARPWRREEAPCADGLVTRTPGVALGVVAADCAPILLCDPLAQVIGAAHGGWRGAVAGIAEATIAAMEGLGAMRGRVRAAIGPCIGPLSYEVGPEFPPPILAADGAAEACFAPAARPGHWLFDLAAYLEHRLRRCGVAAIECAGRDTAAEEEEFFSYRRARLRGEPGYGRALSAIALAD